MAKHALKILLWEHRKIFKVCLAIFIIMHERIKDFDLYMTTFCRHKTNTSFIIIFFNLFKYFLNFFIYSN